MEIYDWPSFIKQISFKIYIRSLCFLINSDKARQIYNFILWLFASLFNTQTHSWSLCMWYNCSCECDVKHGISYKESFVPINCMCDSIRRYNIYECIGLGRTWKGHLSYLDKIQHFCPLSEKYLKCCSGEKRVSFGIFII